ncbi:uncharacterized protein LODBEIA_P18890 [Lodderomyces beijingensis]|uniref:NADP-dependent oxidoreductase domain-containing protein n=1 Tax=Lodderomyces beijingensis TaxID=1775926 RepID=A0ABP0ZN07_9ASCO
MSKAVKISGKLGLGTMSLTYKPNPPQTKQSIEVLNYAVNDPDVNVRFINGADFYGPKDDRSANLRLLKDFVDRNKPDLNQQLVLSLKGGLDFKSYAPLGSKEGIAKSIERIASVFPQKEGRPKILFELTRVDRKVPYEESIAYIQDHVDEGTIDGISLSEVGINSIQKATQVAPVSCVELELSLIAQDVIHNGILAELSQKQIPLIAYSPMGRGLLSDFAVEKPDRFLDSIKNNKSDVRNNLDKFKPDNFKHNLVALRQLYNYAHEVKGTSLQGLALSWLLKLSQHESFKGIGDVTKIVPIPSASTKQKLESNFSSIVELTDEDLDIVDQILSEHPIKGLRYNKMLEKTLFA